MHNPYKLTPVEWEIMEAIWEIGGSPTVRDVLEHAYPQGEKAYTTIQTIMLKLYQVAIVEFSFFLQLTIEFCQHKNSL